MMAVSSQGRPTNYQELELIRVRHDVRLVEDSEEGTSVEQLPDGVYGYTYSPGATGIPLFAKRAYHNFEVHKAANGNVYVIGFVTAEEAVILDAKQEGYEITLYPDPWQDASQLVSVWVADIVGAKRALPREDGNPFRFAIA